MSSVCNWIMEGLPLTEGAHFGSFVLDWDQRGREANGEGCSDRGLFQTCVHAEKGGVC